MKVIQVSDELYNRLKNCVVDPFDDTPESVISRLVEIVDKAKSRWSSFDAHLGTPLGANQENAGGPGSAASQQQGQSQDWQPEQSEHWKEQAEVVL